MSFQKRSILESDHKVLKDIYVDAIESISSNDYTYEQIQAWASKSYLPGLLDKCLTQGKGWASLEKGEIVAFAMRYPSNRLALLYCRGIAKKKGHATGLLRKIEEEASQDGEKYLVTEASFLSQPLLSKMGWHILFQEEILIAGIPFKRHRMKKILFEVCSSDYHQ